MTAKERARLGENGMSNETNTELPGSAIAGIEAESDEAGMFSGTYRVVGMSVVRPVVENLEAERDALRNVCAEAYQLAGALDAPIEAPDNLSAASMGQPLPHESFLPVVANDRIAQQQAGTHPAPCARSCEANAYEIEIRRLKAEIVQLRNAIANEHHQGELSAQSQAILICARIEDEQEGAPGETWARTIRTEIERMLIDHP